MRGRRSGFTLVEVIVTVILLAALAAVTYPTIKARVTDGYENSLINELDNLSSAIISYRQNVGHYPLRLDYLTSLGAGSKDGCGTNTLTVPESSGFRGPYITRNLLNNSGYYIFGNRDTISDTLMHVAGGLAGGVGDYMAILVKGPDSTTIIDVDLKVDGVRDSANGTIRWSRTNGRDTLRYVIPIKTNAC